MTAAASAALWALGVEAAFSDAPPTPGPPAEVERNVFHFEISIPDLERLCPEKNGRIRYSRIHPESSENFADLLCRGRALIDKLGIRNHDGTPVALVWMHLQRRIIAERFSIWTASFRYEQTIAPSPGKTTTRDVRISIPLARVPIVVKPTTRHHTMRNPD